MEKVLELLKKATFGEIVALFSALIAIVGGIGSLVVLVEERYAKEKQIQEQQKIIEDQQHMLRDIFNSFSEDTRKKMAERRKIEETMKMYPDKYIKQPEK